MKVLVTARYFRDLNISPPPLKDEDQREIEVPDDTETFLKFAHANGRFTVIKPKTNSRDWNHPLAHPTLYTLHFENDYD